MELNIRQAQPSEGAKIAPLIYDAIEDIAYRITGEKEESAMLKTLEAYVAKTNNRHSYLNTYVAEDEDTNEILGIVVLYDGKTGNKLDRILEEELIASKGKKISIDVEAYDDEYYIDTICVTKNARGNGIGSELLQFSINKGKELGYHKISLNVDVDKTKARKLYGKIGFEETEPWTIIGEPFIHMVKILS